ncbi:MAG: NAD(P)-dependent oxidoreductase [Alphaproteobacteria bacterium]
MSIIAFVGLGIMGRSMARNLMRAGHALFLHTRTRARAEDLLGEGAEWRDSPAAAVAGAGIAITMVGLPAEVEEVYYGPSGLLDAAAPGTFLIDMSTSPPDLAERIHRDAAGRGLRALDAPVSGGDVGARDATLAVMVGGERADFEAMEPVLAGVGRTIVHVGPAGSGQHCKMVNQIVIGGTMLGVAEALTYGRRAGLDAATVLRVIGGGAAGSFALNHLGPRMAAGDFAPGFMVEHFVKDMTIAAEESRRFALDLPGLALAHAQYRRLLELGNGRDGTQALFRLYNP